MMQHYKGTTFGELDPHVLQLQILLLGYLLSPPLYFILNVLGQWIMKETTTRSWSVVKVGQTTKMLMHQSADGMRLKVEVAPESIAGKHCFFGEERFENDGASKAKCLLNEMFNKKVEKSLRHRDALLPGKKETLGQVWVVLKLGFLEKGIMWKQNHNNKK
ncbi:unnamed protein product [Lactuca saligna]|uniref:Uncharacterized protein n=1 Tax=Lactuca saligna TaxID=75948 RepID=A0AA35ZNZ0_LACSI|nr:unnamed protein product [Lactuca saligna]